MAEIERTAYEEVCRALVGWQGGFRDRDIETVADEILAASGLTSKLAALEDENKTLRALSSLSPAPQSVGEVRERRAALDVLAERRRQVEAEGWTPEHDDQHINGEMAAAATCYAFTAVRSAHHVHNYVWPWSSDWWKPDGKRRNLVKAGALILAEIERLDRASPSPAVVSLSEGREVCRVWLEQDARAIAAALSSLSPAPQSVGEVRGTRLSINGLSLENVRNLLSLYGGEETDMTVEFIKEGHSGPGFYAWCTEYPEDGTDYLGPASEYSTLSASPSPAAQEDGE